jgi:deoxycytidine triphosphate deaminase
MNTRPTDAQIEELRKAEIERLSKLPRFPSKLPDDERGVLLSDRIKHYCTQYQLVWPYYDKQLRPAAYSLSVGRNYSIRGEPGALNDGMSLTIEPYQVAIIETYETINMPEYLIGRWNVRTQMAYHGLLWVGGAQVDPGFRGHLCCPIYNLSTEPVTLAFRDYLAEIDFATTTFFEDALCKKFPWADRKMIVFPQYPFLSSGIERRVRAFQDTIKEDRQNTRSELERARQETKVQFDKAAESSEGSFHDVRTRIDTFLTLTFTVLAVLFAGLGIIATRASERPDFFSPAVWVSAFALWFALWAYVDSRRDTRWKRHSPPFSLAVALVITALAVIACQLFYTYQAHVSATEVREAKEQVSRAVAALDQEKQLRQRSEESLQRQVDMLQNQTKRK